ncbi:MAG: hypothetical protein CM1200mP10_10680 [Candidatus Neomarinimicrobiota bacterium]|nr:MAG: hypothetical protein CM1200mP10_10680 [Candidatus Neomarinimicrobiota bacterium]
MENNAFFTFADTDPIAVGTQFVASAEFFHSSVDSFSTLVLTVLCLQNIFLLVGFLRMESVNFEGSATADAWHHLDVLGTVPAGATIVQLV